MYKIQIHNLNSESTTLIALVENLPDNPILNEDVIDVIHELDTGFYEFETDQLDKSVFVRSASLRYNVQEHLFKPLMTIEPTDEGIFELHMPFHDEKTVYGGSTESKFFSWFNVDNRKK